jgi:hypothetical protein
MTKKLTLSANQVTALCKGAAKAGYAPVVQFGDVFVRLVPEDHAIPPQPDRPIARRKEVEL